MKVSIPSGGGCFLENECNSFFLSILAVSRTVMSAFPVESSKPGKTSLLVLLVATERAAKAREQRFIYELKMAMDGVEEVAIWNNTNSVPDTVNISNVVWIWTSNYNEIDAYYGDSIILFKPGDGVIDQVPIGGVNNLS